MRGAVVKKDDIGIAHVFAGANKQSGIRVAWLRKMDLEGKEGAAI
jgi:hypothetical protein